LWSFFALNIDIMAAAVSETQYANHMAPAAATATAGGQLSITYILLDELEGND